MGEVAIVVLREVKTRLHHDDAGRVSAIGGFFHVDAGFGLVWTVRGV